MKHRLNNYLFFDFFVFKTLIFVLPEGAAGGTV